MLGSVLGGTVSGSVTSSPRGYWNSNLPPVPLFVKIQGAA